MPPFANSAAKSVALDQRGVSLEDANIVYANAACYNGIMKIIALLTLGLGSLALAPLAHGQPNDTPTTTLNPPNNPVRAAKEARPADPKAQIEFDLRSLFGALNALSSERFAINYDVPAAISGARIGYFGLSEWAADFARQRGAARYILGKIDVETLEENAARVKVSYSLRVPGAEAAVAGQQETLDLRREIVPWDKTQKWRIVAPSFANLQPYRRLSLASIAYFGGQRAGTLSQLRAEVSASNLKQCALGVLQFLQDYEQNFALENEFWREAIRPYVQKDSVYAIPGERGFYTFNDHLSDKSLESLGDAAKTVLFYEGRNEEPEFRYDNRAAICFADGHVELIPRAQEQALIWKPRAP